MKFNFGKKPNDYPSDGLKQYMILFNVMKDEDKFSQLLQNVVNFYEKHSKENEKAKEKKE